MATVVLNGNTYADNQGEAARYMSNGGHRTWLFPMLQDLVAEVSRTLTTTSTTLYTLGSGTGSITMADEAPFVAGSFVLLADAAAPTTNYAFVQVTSRSGTTLNFTEVSVTGSGSISNWNVQVSGLRGATGPTGGITGGTLSGDLDMGGNVLTASLVRSQVGGEHVPSATSEPSAVSGAQALTIRSFSSNWMVANGDVTLTVSAGNTAGYLVDGATLTFQQDVSGGRNLVIVGATLVGSGPTWTGQAGGYKTQLTFWQADDGTVLYAVTAEGF